MIEVDDGSEWIAGMTALNTASNRLVSILDRSRYSSPSFQTLTREALGQVNVLVSSALTAGGY